MSIFQVPSQFTHWSCQMSSLFYQLQACSVNANSMHFIAKCKFRFYYACWMVETPRSRFMLHVFSWRVFKSWSTFSTYCESDFFNSAQWGWKLEGSRMQQIVIGIEPVPGNLLKFLQCKCKLSMRNPSGSNISSCRKYMLCRACGNCKVEKCNNAKEIVYMQCRI